MLDPFLNCNIISVENLPYPLDDGWHTINSVYHYNSLDSQFINFNHYCIQIPFHEVENIHLIYGLDYNFINTNTIPIIKRTIYDDREIWKIDLEHYENLKLQSIELF